MKKTILISMLLVVFGLFNIQAQEKKAKTESKDSEVTFSVKMTCKNCEEKVKKQLAYTKGVKEVTTNLEKQEVTVKYREDKTDKEKLINSLSEIGYSAKVATKDCPAKKGKQCCGSHAKTTEDVKIQKVEKVAK